MKTQITFRTYLKIALVTLSLNGLFATITYAQTIKTVGSTGDYTTLKLAFDAINAGTIQGALTLQITGSTTETASASLNASGSGSANYSSILIYPTSSGLSISGNLALPLIDLYGADNVTIDGRVNATGSTRDLSIINNNTSGTSNTATVRLINSAENNTIQYCTLKGGATGVYSGIVLFTGASSGNGNDGNTIDNCNLTSLSASNRPYYVIYSYGSSSRTNSNNTISNNSIYNFLRTGSTSYGVYIYQYSTDWTITGNSLFETTGFNPTESSSYFLIRVSNTAGNNFNVSDNFIGGSSASCSGTWNFGNTSSASPVLYAIHMEVGTTTASSVQNNTIKGFDIETGSSYPFMAIDLNAGRIDCGTLTGNTIGSETGTGSITITNTARYATSYGLYVNSTGVVNVENNKIGSITAVSSTTRAHSFWAIHKTYTLGNINIRNNLIGSLTTASSIQASTSSTYSTSQNVYGLNCNGRATALIENNTIANLSNAYAYTSATSGQVIGILTTNGTNTIQNNVIRDLSTTSPCNDPNGSAAVIGISQRSTVAGQTVTGNTVYDLECTYTGTRASCVNGIFSACSTTGTNTISRNFIYGFSTSSTAPTTTPAILSGIKLSSGSTSVYNNIINLGTNSSAGCNISGIYENGSLSNNNNIWFNTIYIGGTPSGATASTYALYSNGSLNTRNIRNNIFTNARSGGTGGSHYAVRVASPIGITIDYNDYYSPGTNGKLGMMLTTDKTSLLDWQNATGHDENSVAINPVFSTAGGNLAENYYTSAALTGITGTGVTSDFTGNARSLTPRMGALESNTYIWQGGSSTDYATASNWTGGTVPPDGSDISFASNPDRACYLDQNRTLRSITNAQGTDFLVTNGHQLTITGDIIFTGGAKIDATSASSIIVLEGDSIPSAAFLSNTVEALTLNNSSGFLLNGDITVTQSLTLTAGELTIGANTLTMNGSLSIGSGSLAGGASSNITFGGTGASTSLPAITLNILTINRSNGISLTGNVNVGGTLALTVGVLSLGANTLTLSGNSPTSGGGTVDASNAAANLIFANASAITLPATFFTGAVNNLTLSGAGGVTAGSDITVNGILNLAASNPSATKGLLEMTISYTDYPGTTTTNYLNSYLLNMASGASTIGTGDVTGTVKRTTIVANTPYTFGHQYTTVALTTGTMPEAISVTITIGNSPPGDDTPSAGDDILVRDSYKRTYEIVPTVPGGYTSTSRLSANFHYLDSELSSSLTSHVNTEATTVTRDYDIGGGIPTDEHGRSNYDFTNNYIGLSNIPIDYFIKLPTTHDWRTIFTLRDYAVSHVIWNGNTSTDWYGETNWTPNGLVGVGSHVIIPNVTTTNNRSPILPNSATINTLTIENGGVLVMGTHTLTIQTSLSGGWEDQNPLGNDPGTSKVIFSNPGSTVSGNARFYDVEIANGAELTNQTGSTMKIENSLVQTGTGTWYTDVYDNTVEYSKAGDQSIILPSGASAYRNLLLSGSGTKTLPSGALSIHGNLTTRGTVASVAAQNLSIDGNLSIESGTGFTSGAYSHTLKGNLINDGTFTPTDGSTFGMNGTNVQTIGGSVPTSFYNLDLNNSSGISLGNDVNVSNTLSFSSGKMLLGDNDLLMGASATFTGNTSSKYMVTNGTGSLRQRVTNNATNVTFPIGLESEYLPVAIQLTVGSTADDIKARVTDGLYTSYDVSDVPDGTLITEQVVKKTWYLGEETVGGSNATVNLQWNASGEGTNFDRSKSHIALYTTGAWVHSAGSSATGSDPYTQNLTGITSFAPLGIFGQTITCTLTGSEICAGSSVTIDFTVSGGDFTSGNVFTAQLSDAFGSFVSPTALGTLTGITSGSIYAAIPVSTAYGTAYHIRVVGSTPAVEGNINGTDLTINIPSYIGTAPTVGNLSASGTGIKWYDAATDGNLLSSGTALVNGQVYYASQTVNSCESTDRFAVTATVDPTPCAPTASSTQSGATVANLTATGQNIKWYNVSSGGTALAPWTTLVPGTYYASQTIDCTESTGRVAVTVTGP